MTNVILLDENLSPLIVIDNYESLIWTDRYWSCGDFELYISTVGSEYNYIDYLQKGYYLSILESRHTMIIETVTITTDTDNGDHIKVTGRTLESILDRRIIWGLKIINKGSLQARIKELINECIISPKISQRKIANFIFEDSTDSAVTKLNIGNTQFTGDNLYDVITNICELARSWF